MVGDSLTNATAVGAGASVTQSNSLVLGSGVNVGIGTTAPQSKLHVIDPSNKGLRVGTGSRGGTVASFGGFGEFQIDSNGRGDCPGCFPKTDRLVVGGTVSIFSLGSAGSSSLCLNGSHQISACSSSVRYKTNIAGWRGGLSLINRLRPVTFD